MPINLNGKINRKKLIDSHQLSQLFNKESIAPKTKDEKTLYELTKQVLKMDDFGVTDDLTLLGLTSLSAIKLADLANRDGLYIKVNDILRNKSIRDILINEQSVGKWENGYDASKPVIVLIQGFTYYKLMEPIISKLSKHYSVFVFEPLDDHYNVLFNEDNVSSNDIVDFYLDYLEANLPSHVNVQMFIGHCFGGELAYRCTVRWHKKTGIMPKICMLDTYVHVNDIVLKIPIPEIENPTPDEASDINKLRESNRRFRQIQTMINNHDLPGYDGDVLYFKAKELTMSLKTIHINEHEVDQKREEDLNNWKSLVPNMKIYPIEAEHFTMLDEKFCDNYLEIIDNIVLPHNT
jgi:surfactin family lipopeptide synthetase A